MRFLELRNIHELCIRLIYSKFPDCQNLYLVGMIFIKRHRARSLCSNKIYTCAHYELGLLLITRGYAKHPCVQFTRLQGGFAVDPIRAYGSIWPTANPCERHYPRTRAFRRNPSEFVCLHYRLH